MKAIRQRDAGIFVSWTDLDDGSPDLALRQLASQLLPVGELDALWVGQVTDIGTLRPLRPAIDVTERGLLEIIGRVLSSLTYATIPVASRNARVGGAARLYPCSYLPRLGRSAASLVADCARRGRTGR